MSITFSSDPTVWGELDGIYIDETSPPPSVTGVPANIAICIGQFERGPVNSPQSVGSTGQLFEMFGNNLNYSGNVSLSNKRFGTLKVIRAAAAGAVNALHTFNHSSAAVITFTALWPGQYGNAIKVTVAAGSTQGSKYTVHDANANAVSPDEVYDNVLITAISAAANPFAHSNLVTATVVSSVSGEPDPVAATALGSGADGSIADTDYQSAVSASQVSGLGNILFLDAYNATRNGYLKVSMAATTDKMCVVCGQPGDAVSDAVTAVSSLRDTDGRIIYSFPYVYTTVGGVSTKVPGGSFYASLMSQIAPNIDPAFAGNVQFLAGIDSLELNLQSSDYQTLMAKGISAFEVDSDLGIKIKSGVVTQIADSSKLMVFRRRMADYIVQSLGKFLKNFQNGLNSAAKKRDVAGAMNAFNRLLEAPIAGGSGLVPSDAEVSSGKASLIDVNSLNTDSSTAAGYFKILYKRRIYSSMRFIVLQAEIGESVVVTSS